MIDEAGPCMVMVMVMVMVDCWILDFGSKLAGSVFPPKIADT